MSTEPREQRDVSPCMYLVDEYDGPLQEEPEVALVPHPVVHGGVAAVEDPARHHGRQEVADRQAEQPDDDLVNLRRMKRRVTLISDRRPTSELRFYLQFEGQPVVRLALPLLGRVPLAVVVEVL